MLNAPAFTPGLHLMGLVFVRYVVWALNAHSKWRAKHDWVSAVASEGTRFEIRCAVATAQALRFVARAVTEWERGFCCVRYVRYWVCCVGGDRRL